MSAGPALAHQCTNASKPADSGWRVLFGPGGLTFNDPGLERQFTKDQAGTIERFSGIVGIDFDGDGVADFSTYFVGPEDELPHEAQEHGPACRGIVNFRDYFSCAAGVS